VFAKIEDIIQKATGLTNSNGTDNNTKYLILAIGGILLAITIIAVTSKDDNDDEED